MSVDGWDRGPHLAGAVARAGLDLLLWRLRQKGLAPNPS